VSTKDLSAISIDRHAASPLFSKYKNRKKAG